MKTMFIRLRPLLLFMGGMIILPLISAAEPPEIQVREIKTTLFNRPVTGYRLTIPKNRLFLHKKIRAHIQRVSSLKPFEYERSIIYEHISYPPITDQKELSLHFQLQEIENQHTILVVVALYEYNRPIQQKDFPILSHRLLEDLALLTNQACNADITFEGKIYGTKQASQNVSPTSQSKMVAVEHYQEEEVENHSILIKESPFDSKSAPKVQASPMTEEELAQWQHVLTLKAQSLKSQAITANKIGPIDTPQRYFVLQDSLQLLRKELERLQNFYLNADDISVESSSSEQVIALQKKLDAQVRTQNKLQGQITEYEKQIDALKATVNRKEATIEQLKGKLEDAQNLTIAGENSKNSSDSLNSQLRKQFEIQSTQYHELKQKYLEAINQNDKLRRQLTKSASLLQELQTVSANTQKSVETYQQKMNALEGMLSNLRGKLDAFAKKEQQINDSIIQLKQKSNAYEKAYYAQKNELDALKSTLRATEKGTPELSAQIKVLQIENRKLRTTLDSLSKQNAPEGQQQQFIREQWKKLEQWERQLSQKEDELNQSMKIITQRTTFLDQKALELNEQEKKLTQLLKDIDEAKIEATQAKNQFKHSGPDIRIINGIEYNEDKRIPVFKVATTFTYKQLQLQIVSFMSKKGWLYDEMLPGLLYQEVDLANISDTPLTIAFLIRTSGSNSNLAISFLQENGNYLEPPLSTETQSAIHQFIAALLTHQR